MTEARILVVDDEPKLVRLVQEVLTAADFAVLIASWGEQALEMIALEQPDLILLDIVLAGELDGFEVARRIREFSNVPLIMLTARARESDLLHGFEVGADDYLTKPFSAKGLLARVRVVLKRSRQEAAGQSEAEIHCGPLRIDLARRRVFVAGQEVHLTRTEYNLLHELAAHVNQVMLHEQLLTAVWGFEYRDDVDYLRAGSAHTLTDEIKKLKYPTQNGRRKMMVIEVKICRCPNCESTDIVRNGTDYKGDQKYHCHQCGGYGTLNPKARYSQKEQAQILKAYQERASMRGIRRIFGVVPQTLLRWIKATLEKLPSLLQTLDPGQPDDVLELDELWSFVLKKSNKRWIWIALCRRTRQVVAYYVGDRSEVSCRQLWQRIPATYKSCISYSDFWTAYQKVWPQATHQAVGKETGQTAHVERWNNTLRQRLARFVRKTLSFSKSDLVHDLVLRFFIINYNLQCSISQ